MLIEFKNVTKEFIDGSNKTIMPLNNINFQIKKMIV